MLYVFIRKLYTLQAKSLIDFIDSCSDWLKMFDEFFRHEKVEMIPTFSSRNISPHFACKTKQTKVSMLSIDFSS